MSSLCLWLFSFSFLSCLNACAQDWEELKGEHFIIYSTGEKKFAQEALDMSETYYRRIASDLGYPRHSEFWTWDKRVKIYIYPDHASYLEASGQPDWSQGLADYKDKKILSYAWSKGFLESLLPHEIAHLIFRDFVSFEGEIPLWLDEGIAQWEEEGNKAEINAKTKELYDKNALLSIGDIARLDIRTIDKNEKRLYWRGARTKSGRTTILLLSPDVLINTFYIEAASLVGFLIETYGSLTFASFCRELRDGKTLEEAIAFAYPEHLRSMREFEDRWREYIAKT